MAADEVGQRLVICARLLDAWPNSRPTNRDRTLVEYVNATRGVRLDRLPRCVQFAIDAGGEWLPAAGEVVRRAAVQGCGGPVVGTDPDARYWHELKVSRLVAQVREDAERVATLNPDVPLVDQSRQAAGEWERSGASAISGTRRLKL